RRARRPPFGCRSFAVDAVLDDVDERVAEGVERRLRRPVGADEAGLPARELRLVLELEVEPGTDERLAVGEADRSVDLRRLLLLRDRVAVGLGAGVELARGRQLRLEAVLHVPDGRAAFAGRGLSSARERAPQRRDEPVVVALVDRVAAVLDQ